MKNKTLFLAAAILMLAAPVFGQYMKKSIAIIDELGDPVTNITSITILDAGTSSNSTLYGNTSGEISVTNPITTGSANSTFSQSMGYVTFWTRAASYKVTITDGTYTKTWDNLTGTRTRVPFFASYIGASSAYNLGDDDDLNFGASDDWVLTWNTSTSALDATPAADDSAWNMGSASKTSDLNLFGGTSGVNLYWDASENTLEFLDAAIAAWGDGDDFTISHDGVSTTTLAGTFSTTGIVTLTADVIFDGTYDVQWDDNRYQLGFLDNALLGIGGAADGASRITFTHDATDLLMEAAVADDLWKIGYTTNFDMAIYGDTNTQFMYWDTGSELVYLEGYDMRFNDADELKFGDDSDFVFDSSTTKILDVLSGETDESGAIYWGSDQLGFDQKFFGATASAFMVFDAGADELIFDLADLKLSQGSQIEFVDSGGTTVDWTIDLSTNEVLLFLPAETTDDQSFNIGDATNTSDVRFFGMTASTVVYDSTGNEVRFNAYDVALNDDDYLNFGDANEVSTNFDEDGMDDLQVKGPVNFETTYVEFRNNPIVMEDDFSAPDGTAADTIFMAIGDTNFEYFYIGTQAIFAPVLTATGLDIRLDETTAEGMEMGEGITARSPSAFTIGTDAFYLKVQFEIEAVAEMSVVAIGFRLAGAYNADIFAYDTYAGINVNNGAVNGIDELNGGSAHETSLGQSAWTDGQIFTLEVRIDAAKAVTQYQSSQGAGNRGTTAVTTPLAFSWTDTDTVVPFIRILGDNTAGCEINLLSYECGLQ